MPDGKEHSWAHTDRGPYIKTYTGRKVYLADPRPEDFSIADIARHLAGINRYTGGSRYSVAQHCVVASKLASIYYPDAELLPAKMLIHDADEAYVGDVSSPLKSLLPDYKRIESNFQAALEKFFDLTFMCDPLVKEADYRMWLTEYACGVGQVEIVTGNEHYTGSLRPFGSYANEWFEEWSADEAEAAWLESYRSLFPWLQ